MREPLRFSWRHWWNLAAALILGAGVAAWSMRLLDGRLALFAVLAWLAGGTLIAPSILYEHLGFLDRHVFHDYAKARLRYRKAVETGTATPQAFCALASLSLAEGDAQAAAELLEEAVIKRPDDAQLLALLSKTLSRLGRHDESVAAALRCRELKGESALSDVALGDALKAKGEDQGAAAAYQKALQRSPRLMSCRVSLAETYLAMGQVDAAEEEISLVLETSAHHADALYWAGRIACIKGDPRTARRYLQGAIEKRPVDDRALAVPYRDVIKAYSLVAEDVRRAEVPDGPSLGQDVG